MEAKETDKLFRDKLKNSPSVPKADNWDKLESMLDDQEKVSAFSVWHVAAALLLLVVSGWIIFFWGTETPTEDQVAQIEIPSESLNDSHQIVPEKVNDVKKEVVVDEEPMPVVNKQKKEEKVSSVEPEKTVIEVENEPEVKRVEITETSVPEGIQLAENHIETTEIEDQPKKKKIKSIKITYKRGSRSQPKPEEMLAKQEADTTGGKKIKELWDQTREIKPGDLWADIRDAKDHLFKRNSKKNNVKNLNK
ncbi:hypothetical protein [Reichenbachiella sp.]|uniref:hypothetical protein n=1 Tax=Reichenbachiella sp. TaxID=2184521 RepID=UPI003B5CEFEB